MDLVANLNISDILRHLEPPNRGVEAILLKKQMEIWNIEDKNNGQSENDMLSTCFDMANQNLKDKDQFLIGLQNENQFFY